MKFDTSALRDAIRAATTAVGEAVGESSLRAAGVAGAAVFRDEAIRNAGRNRQTGVLQNNIIMKRQDEDSDGARRQAYVVTVRTGKYGADGDAFYWRFVEGGHKIITRRKGQKLSAARKAAEKAAAKAEFGSATVPAYPFMRPAYESKKQEAVTAMQAALTAAVKKRLENT